VPPRRLVTDGDQRRQLGKLKEPDQKEAELPWRTPAGRATPSHGVRAWSARRSDEFFTRVASNLYRRVSMCSSSGDSSPARDLKEATDG
jgi:hypothetical protein